MTRLNLSRDDIDRLNSQGITVEEVVRQIEIFKNPLEFVRLSRACTLGDGVKKFSESEIKEQSGGYRDALRGRRLIKFVPASGAASRMFKVLNKFYRPDRSLTRDSVARDAEAGDADSREMLTFMDRLKDFAFYEDLSAAMARAGLDVGEQSQKGEFKNILAHLLTPAGLSYRTLPKGLLEFHRYADSDRTSFEEHLVEAADYVRDEKGTARIHFTVSPEHEEGFAALLKRVGPRYEERLGVRFEVSFSEQKKSTDTIAVDFDNRPFRLPDGRLLFRPGGHGALIENINDLNADIVFIKNIDNVVPDRLKEPTFLYKKVLASYLIKLQRRIFDYLKELDQGKDAAGWLNEAIDFAAGELCVSPPRDLKAMSPKDKAAFLKAALNRPLRVCGMVENEGEPGGGPFWVEGKDRALSLQIVESAQIDLKDKSQAAAFKSATHFNPVDIVCGVSDYKGNPFDLKRYINPDAVIISQKSQGGKDLKALELPGLWNGGMAYWNTVFVEVPIVTFNPVKTVNDLLRPEHQP